MIRATFRTRPSRVLCFDLESRPSAYWADRPTAEITAFGWKWEHQPRVHTLLLNNEGEFDRDDGGTLPYGLAYLVFRDMLCKATLVYGHNIRRFDLPLFQAGLLRQELPQLPPLRTTDTLRDYPKRRDMSASLENLARMYGLDEKGKLHMSVVDWEQANRLGQTDKARRRVASDVLLQERLRDKLLDLNLLAPPRMWKP